jgi:transposase
LYACRRNGRKVNADANAALNIARGTMYKVKVTRKIESYIVTHSGVKPLNPRRRNTLDPEV